MPSQADIQLTDDFYGAFVEMCSNAVHLLRDLKKWKQMMILDTRKSLLHLGLSSLTHVRLNTGSYSADAGLTMIEDLEMVKVI